MLAVQTTGDLAAEHAEQTERQHAQQEHRRHEQRRTGLFEYEDADRQHLEPTCGRGARPNHPQTKELRIRQQWAAQRLWRDGIDQWIW